MVEYIDVMIENGFPKSDFDLLGAPILNQRLRKSWNSIHLQKYAIEYCRKNKVDLTALVYTDAMELADQYVTENVPAQFTDSDGNNWYDETYELWTDVFSTLIEEACLELYLKSWNAFMEKTHKTKKLREYE